MAVGWGQSVELSVIGGVPVTEAYETGTGYPHLCNYAGANSATRRYTVGSGFRISLPHGFGVAAGVLYERLGYDDYYENACLATYTRAIENSWEFPVLAAWPEMRYTRWEASTNALGEPNVLQSNQNQVEFLLGFGFRVRWVGTLAVLSTLTPLERRSRICAFLGRGQRRSFRAMMPIRLAPFCCTCLSQLSADPAGIRLLYPDLPFSIGTL
jgi:hypothetical protein